MQFPDIIDVDARIIKVMMPYEKADGEIQGIVGGLRPDDSLRTRRHANMAIKSIITMLGKKRGPQVAGLIRLAYVRGIHLVEKEDKLSQEDMSKIATIVESLNENLIMAEATVIKNTHNIVRKMKLLSVAQQSGGRLADTLQVAGLVDRAGTRWRLAPYASMAIRTATHEALTEGTLAAMKNHGYDEIKVSTEPGSISAACEPWDGGTFSLSGENTNLKTLTAVPPFHPSCNHYLYREAA